MDMFQLNLCILLLLYHSPNILPCPPECVCSEPPITVNCDNKRLNDTDIERLVAATPVTTEILKFNNNFIKRFPSEIFQKFTDLKELYLNDNRLVEVPRALSTLKKLELDRNRIREVFPGSFLGYNFLEELTMDYNLIEMLPGNTFSGLKVIQKIVISNNNISKLYYNSLIGLSTVKSLSLEGNNIKNFSKDIFLPLRNSLTRLYLSKNRMEKIHSLTYSRLSKLNFLDLQENKIQSIEKYSFRGLTLEYLLLANNRLKHLNREMFENVKINNILTLLGNPLLCDCFLFYALVYFPPNLRLLGGCAETSVALNVMLRKNLLNCTRCSLQPCNKNEICHNIENKTTTKCTCKSGFSGKNCEIFDHCKAKPCLNSGKCANKKDYSTFFCKCTHPFIGYRCQDEIACAVNHCKNGGQCQPVDHIKFQCKCKEGFEGKLCEIKVRQLATQGPVEKDEPDITLFVALGCVCLLLIIALAVTFFVIRRKRMARKNLMVISSPILENHCED